MNLDTFFKSVRRTIFGGSLTVGQVEGMEKILAYWQETYPKMPMDEMAYVLATIAWETGRKMVPVREAGGEAYLRTKKYYPWVGEGLVQVTWEANHRKLGGKKPGDLMQWPIALHAAFYGMTTGLFTGKKLADYIGPGRRDYRQARRIINGMDRSAEIAKYAEDFRIALLISRKPAAPPQPEAPAIPAFDQATFKAWLIDAINNDPDVRGALIAAVFPDVPDEPATDIVDLNDQPHDEYGPEEGDYANLVVKGYEGDYSDFRGVPTIDDQSEPDPRYG